MRKPFSDEHCLQNIANAGAIMALMRSPPAHVAEFGCGSGWLSLLFAERGYDVSGIDISPDAVAMAKTLRAERKLEKVVFQVADYEEVQVSPLADYVVFHDALHHAESPETALRAAYRALVPGGFVICIEPGEGHARSPGSLYAVETYGVHERELPPRVILRYAKAAGFRRHLILPWPWYYFAAVYRPGYSKGKNTADLLGRKLLSLFRFMRWYFRTREQAVVLLGK